MATIEKENALDVVRQMVADGQVSQEVAEKYFPELKESEESEDERIRKDIVFYIAANHKDDGEKARWLYWLEKQGKPTNINPSEFDLRLNKLLKQFETLPKEELASSLAFYLNVVQNDGTKQDEQKPTEWSEEDKETIDYLIDYLESELDSSYTKEDKEEFTKDIKLLKSLRPQSQWKPSEEMLEALYRAIPKNVMAISEDEMLLDKLYQGLKYGRVLGKN